MTIRPANPGDRQPVLAIFMEVVAAGETFALARDLSHEDALAFWWADGSRVFVCEENGQVLGAYYLRPNHAGAGGHVANAGYIVTPAARGKHLGRAMAQHSLDQARQLGFRAMQFNFVISTNTAAIRLWKQLGFDTVGTLPGAFQHPQHGYVDAYVMFKEWAQR